LSSAAASDTAALTQRNWVFGRRIADWTIGLIVFLGGFVIDEPAPYELLLAPVIVIWAFFGLKLNRYILPLVILLICYVAGGFLGLTQLPNPLSGLIYVVVTFFLAASAVFFAAIIAEAPGRRFRIIKNAYIASAVLTSLLAIIGYFHLVPGTDAFLLYGRAKGAFQDPNVFAPFLVLPIVLLYRDVLTSPVRQSLWKAAMLLVLLFAIFIAFSRAAWGMVVLTSLLVTVMSFVTSHRGIERLRIVVFFAIGMLVVVAMVAVALSIPQIHALFEDRGTTLLETYDAGPTGRFARHIQGFFLVQQRPLGLGPLVFSKLLGEDEHNMWLKGFTTYGWLGGFAYIALALWTLAAATPLIFKPRPWQGLVQCVYATFIGHLMIHNVIDNDHWRHLFLIYGLLWGAIAAEKLAKRQARRRVAAEADHTRPLIEYAPPRPG